MLSVTYLSPWLELVGSKICGQTFILGISFNQQLVAMVKLTEFLFISVCVKVSVACHIHILLICM